MKKIVLFSAFFLGCMAGLAFSSSPDYIVIYGDSRSNPEVHTAMVEAIATVHPRVVFHLGDAVNDAANQSDWNAFEKITAPLRERSEFYPVFGNHDKGAQSFVQNLKVFQDKTWYALERCGIYFIVLDSNLDLNPGSTQYNWLEGELEYARQSHTPVIVMMHHPLFSIGKFYRSDAGLRLALVSLFEKYGVIALFSGYDHNYQRFLHRGVYYIVTGGGGAPLHSRTVKNPYNQRFVKAYHFCALSRSGRYLVVDVYDIDLRRIDRFTVRLKV